MSKQTLLKEIHDLSGKYTPEEPYMSNTLKRIVWKLKEANQINEVEEAEILKTLEEVEL